MTDPESATKGLTQKNPDRPDPDYDAYSKSLEKILEQVGKDFWSHHLDLNKHQVGVAKTYLWVAAALVGGYFTAFTKIQEKTIPPTCLTCIANLLLILSFLLALIAFGFCLYSIPNRKGYKMPYDRGWGEYSGQAHKLLTDSQTNKEIRTYPFFLQNFITDIEAAAASNFESTYNRAKQLRLVSWLLICSFVISVPGFAIYYSKYFTYPLNFKEATQMDSSTPKDGPPVSQVPSQTTPGSISPNQPQVPGVPQPDPPPARPSQFTTHGASSPTGNRVLITEGEKKK